MHTNQPRNGRLISRTTQDGHRPGYSSLVGGSAKVTMTSYEEHIELLEEISQANNSVKVRTKELLTQYFGTDDADIRLINFSDVFKEDGIRCE